VQNLRKVEGSVTGALADLFPATETVAEKRASPLRCRHSAVSREYMNGCRGDMDIP